MGGRPQFVDTRSGIQALGRQLEGVGLLALDTEFHSEHRFRPQLMLLQLAAPDGHAWVIDPLNNDLSPLGPVLASARLLVHGGQADMALVLRATGVRPRRVLDTQVAAGLVGHRYPARLGDLVHGCLGTHLDKSEGLSDWSRRPLTPEQWTYAVEDAVILLPLAAHLEGRLAELGRLELAWDASIDVLDEAVDEAPDLDSWVHWDVAPTFGEEERRVLRALYAWREQRGREKDQPPRYMLAESFALDLARRRPSTLAELSSNRRFPSGLVKRHGADLVDVIRAALQDGRAPPAVPTLEQQAMIKGLELWASAFELSDAVSARLLLPRGVALEVARGGGLAGWRHRLAGARLQRFLEGREGIGVRDGRPTLCAFGEGGGP